MAVLVVRQTHLAVSVGGLRFAASPKISAERKYPRGENIPSEKISVVLIRGPEKLSVRREYPFGENQNVVGSKASREELVRGDL